MTFVPLFFFAFLGFGGCRGLLVAFLCSCGAYVFLEMAFWSFGFFGHFCPWYWFGYLPAEMVFLGLFGPLFCWFILDFPCCLKLVGYGLLLRFCLCCSDSMVAFTPALLCFLGAVGWSAFDAFSVWSCCVVLCFKVVELCYVCLGFS